MACHQLTSKLDGKQTSKQNKRGKKNKTKQCKLVVSINEQGRCVLRNERVQVEPVNPYRRTILGIFVEFDTKSRMAGCYNEERYSLP